MSRSMRTAAEMYPLVEAYLSRETTKKAFCLEHAVSESVLSYWVTKYRRSVETETVSFMEITPEASFSERALMEVVFPDGVRLRLFSPVTPGYLEQLLGLGRSAA